MTGRSSETGFTLVELAISMGVVIVLFMSMMQLEESSAGLTSATLVSGRVEEAVGQTTMAVGAELRWARPDTLLITPESGSDRVDFVASTGYVSGAVVWSTPITIRYEPDAGDANENGVADEGALVRIQDGVRRVLCRNVQLGGFTVNKTDELLEIQLTAFGPLGEGQLVQRSGQYSTVLMNREVP